MVYTYPKGFLYTYKKKSFFGKLVKVQLIVERYYSSLEELINSFDIVACCAATDGNEIVYNDNFIQYVSNKIITINKLSYPVATLGRIVKYAKKGYFISGNELENLLEAVMSDPEKYDFRYYID